MCVNIMAEQLASSWGCLESNKEECGCKIPSIASVYWFANCVDTERWSNIRHGHPYLLLSYTTDIIVGNCDAKSLS